MRRMVCAGRCTALSLLNTMCCGRSWCDTKCLELWGRQLCPTSEAKGLKSSC